MKDNEPIMVSEPAVAYAPSMFDKVIGYLHSSQMPLETKRAVCLQLQAEVADENLGYMKRRLKEYADLQSGWDGEDAQPVLSEVLSFMSQLLHSCSSKELAEWALFPNVNGTFLLQRKNAAISIGKNEYSYFAEAAFLRCSRNVPFTFGNRAHSASSLLLHE